MLLWATVRGRASVDGREAFDSRPNAKIETRFDPCSLPSLLPPHHTPQGVEGVDYHIGSVDDLDPSEWRVPAHCIPVHANVTTYDWGRLAAAIPGGFDAVMMDPPWQLATANPTRGVALGYSQLTDADILNLPMHRLQSSGYLFVWVINAKYRLCLDMFEKWGYELSSFLVLVGGWGAGVFMSR